MCVRYAELWVVLQNSVCLCFPLWSKEQTSEREREGGRTSERG